jgi:hypothetical protein
MIIYHYNNNTIFKCKVLSYNIEIEILQEKVELYVTR